MINALIPNITPEEVRDNNRKYEERLLFYKKYGLDQLRLRHEIVAELPRVDRVLEIGTGKGHLTMALAQRAQQVVSVDVNEEDMRTAYLNLVHATAEKNVQLILSDARLLSFDDQSFDAVVSAFAFHHFEYPFAVLKEMLRLAGRYIIVSDFNEQGFQVISSIHQAENREHNAGPGDFHIVGEYIKQHGLDVTMIRQQHQTIYLGERKAIVR